jgi:hypothetical protein
MPHPVRLAARGVGDTGKNPQRTGVPITSFTPPRTEPFIPRAARLTLPLTDAALPKGVAATAADRGGLATRRISLPPGQQECGRYQRTAAGLLPARRLSGRPALRLLGSCRRPPAGRPSADAPDLSTPGQAATWLETERQSTCNGQPRRRFSTVPAYAAARRSGRDPEWLIWVPSVRVAPTSRQAPNRSACNLARYWRCESSLTVEPAHTTGPVPIVAESARRISPACTCRTETTPFRADCLRASD